MNFTELRNEWTSELKYSEDYLFDVFEEIDEMNVNFDYFVFQAKLYMAIHHVSGNRMEIKYPNDFSVQQVLDRFC